MEDKNKFNEVPGDEELLDLLDTGEDDDEGCHNGYEIPVAPITEEEVMESDPVVDADQVKKLKEKLDETRPKVETRGLPGLTFSLIWDGKVSCVNVTWSWGAYKEGDQVEFEETYVDWNGKNAVEYKSGRSINTTVTWFQPICINDERKLHLIHFHVDRLYSKEIGEVKLGEVREARKAFWDLQAANSKLNSDYNGSEEERLNWMSRARAMEEEIKLAEDLVSIMSGELVKNNPELNGPYDPSLDETFVSVKYGLWMMIQRLRVASEDNRDKFKQIIVSSIKKIDPFENFHFAESLPGYIEHLKDRCKEAEGIASRAEAKTRLLEAKIRKVREFAINQVENYRPALAPPVFYDPTSSYSIPFNEPVAEWSIINQDGAAAAEPLGYGVVAADGTTAVPGAFPNGFECLVDELDKAEDTKGKADVSDVHACTDEEDHARMDDDGGRTSVVKEWAVLSTNPQLDRLEKTEKARYARPPRPGVGTDLHQIVEGYIVVPGHLEKSGDVDDVVAATSELLLGVVDDDEADTATKTRRSFFGRIVDWWNQTEGDQYENW